MINSNLYPDVFCENHTYVSSFGNVGSHPIIQVYRYSQGRPMLVIGEGSIGKSTAMIILQAQLLHEGIPCFLFECKYIIATPKIAVTLDNCSKKWYNMSQGDEKNGQNAAQ